jgi:gp16 family phage-associated protein
MTAEQVKQKFNREGKTFMKWARENGYRPQDVYRVLNGQAKARYGIGHEIAIKLGIKNAETKAA